MGNIDQFLMTLQYHREKIDAKEVVDFLRTKYEQIGWELEYESEGLMHIFYTHPAGEPREAHNIRTASMLSIKTVQHFIIELADIVYK